MTRRIYIAGPMTGIAEHNYPAFHEAAARLRAEGLEVESPAEHETPPPCGTYAGWLRLGLAKLLRCQEVAVLSGWYLSNGARLEVSVAQRLEMPVWCFPSRARVTVLAEGRP